MLTRQQQRICLFVTTVFVTLILAGMLPVADPNGQLVFAQARGTPTIRRASGTGTAQSLFLPLVMRDSPLPPIIPPTTKPLSADTTQYLSSISADGATFPACRQAGTFSQMTPELSALAPSDVIVGDVSAVAPNGFLRKVTSVTSVAGAGAAPKGGDPGNDCGDVGRCHLPR
jgi:hypothetical protein